MSVTALWMSSLACDPTMAADPTVPRGGTEELVANLVDAGFDEADIELRPDGQALVEGDVLVSLEASRAWATTEFRQYRTDARVDTEHDDIIVYVDPKLRNNAVFLQAVHEAIARWNGVRSRFKLEMAYGDEETDETSIELWTWEVATPDDRDAVATFPSDGKPGSHILINPHKLGSSYRVLRHMVMHELGHTLGLRHTDYTTRGSCDEDEQGPEDDEQDVGAVHIDGTPGSEGDARSVMNACIPTDTPAEWTCYDRRAIKAL